MTKQEYYDLLVCCAFDGGFPAMEFTEYKTPQCKYKFADGRKCAVGLLIRDGHYHSGLEGKRVRSWTDSELNCLSMPDDTSLDDISAVQSEHDFNACYRIIDKLFIPNFIASLNRLTQFEKVTKVAGVVQ